MESASGKESANQPGDSTATTPAGYAAGWQVLFVGGDPLWFGQLQRDVECLQSDWRCLHAADYDTAFKTLASEKVDALVVDGRAPNARRVIDSVRRDMPAIHCLIRCDMSDRNAVDSWKGLDVPIVDSNKDASSLISNLLRSARLQEWAANDAIKAMLPRIRKLPATPKLYVEVTEELKRDDGSLDVIARLIQQDPVMSAKLLQLVNSAFFSSAREITDMLDAAMILGTERIKSLILLAGIFSQYSSSGPFASTVQALLAHSIRVGTLARAIALSETKSQATAEAAFTAGILHDVGKLIVAGNIPEMFDRVQKFKTLGKLPEPLAELEVYGVSHTKLGACLLAAWGLPLPILEAIAYHNDPEQSSSNSFSLLAAVHAANAFAHESDPPLPASKPHPSALNLRYLERIGMPDRAGRWRDLCLEVN